MKNNKQPEFKQKTLAQLLFIVSVIAAISIAGFSYYFYRYNDVNDQLSEIRTGYSKKVWLPGEEVETENFNITINQATKDDVGIPKYLPAPEGLEFFTVDIAVKNKTSEDLLFLPVNSTFLKDQDGNKYGLTAAPNVESGIAGNVVAGEQNSGQIGFLIPNDTTEIRFYFEPYGEDVGNTIIIDLSQYL